VFICTSLSDWFHRPLLAASPEPIVGGSRFAWVWMIDHSATWLRRHMVSSTVKDLVVGSELHFTERGVHALRGVPGEWRVYALAE
jgi:hypothetical protein